VYNHCNVCKIPIYFFNINMKHLQHIYKTSETLKTYILRQMGGRGRSIPAIRVRAGGACDGRSEHHHHHRPWRVRWAGASYVGWGARWGSAAATKQSGRPAFGQDGRPCRIISHIYNIIYSLCPKINQLLES
jgi:hypothetical protein